MGRRGQPWLEQIEEWKGTKPLSYDAEVHQHQAPVRDREALRNEQGEGDHHHRSGTEPDVDGPVFTSSISPTRFITSGGLGCMGFGLPAAIGAQIACPDRLVVDIAGDGSIQMNIQEMATAVQYGLPVKIADPEQRLIWGWFGSGRSSFTTTDMPAPG